ALDSATVERYAQALRLPLSGDADSLAVAYAQVLLDRAGFSPGHIDGRWGQNTEEALLWRQRAEGLPATGTLDGATLARLAAMAEAPARPEQLIVAYALSAEDVEGPFAELPDDVYALAELDRLGYRDLAEKLGERFHASPDLLRQLNPGAP